MGLSRTLSFITFHLFYNFIVILNIQTQTKTDEINQLDKSYGARYSCAQYPSLKIKYRLLVFDFLKLKFWIGIMKF